MAHDSEPNPEVLIAEEEQPEQAVDDVHDAPAHHPSAPPDELFDISTTVDPSYIISLIRKLIPIDTRKNHNSQEVDVHNDCSKGLSTDKLEEREANPSRDQVLNSVTNGHENMDVDGFDKTDCRGDGVLGGEDTWEEYGCLLWDFAASKTHAELMVQNLVLEVLMANLMVSQSVRVMEICLGIIGNLACHEVPMKHIVSTNGLIEIIVNQLFLEDTQCLCEACWLLTSGLQSGECNTWAEAMQSEHILSRIMWISENTLNPQLLEKSIGLLLAVLEGQREVSNVILQCLLKLGLPSLLVDLLAFEMSRLTSERVPERFPVLDVILRAAEALSTLDGHSQEICSNKLLFQLICDLVKMSDKVEVVDSCVTAAVLIANILSDVPDLASKISQDLSFLQGLLDIFPFASDDLEARSALWSIVARLLVQVNESEMSWSSLQQYVSALVSKSDLIEDDLLDQQLDNSCEESKSSNSSIAKSNARTAALQRIISILNLWAASKDSHKEDDTKEEQCANEVDVNRLLDICHKYTKHTESAPCAGFWNISEQNDGTEHQCST